MEKLIELFKEYVDNHGTDTKDIEKEYGVIDYGQGFQYGTREYLYETIISKKFGFISWLVENDKIKPLRKFIGWETDEDEPYIQFDLVDQYIAYLSIQDEPINFLISILK